MDKVEPAQDCKKAHKLVETRQELLKKAEQEFSIAHLQNTGDPAAERRYLDAERNRSNASLNHQQAVEDLKKCKEGLAQLGKGLSVSERKKLH
jgi:hypothetical protein